VTFRAEVKRLAAVLAAVVVIGVPGAGFHQLLAQERPAGQAADGDVPSLTVLMTRQWTPDGKVPTGTVWRGFQTWRTDVARTEKGELVPVDPLTSRVGRNDKGEVVRYNYNQPGWALHTHRYTKLEIYPAKEVHGSAWPPANWQSPDFDDGTWVRECYPQRELYGLVALRCLRGRFEVTDPAKVSDLTLTVRFRGGVVAYLNGKEVGRAFLSKGEIQPDTPAEDYPKEAFVDSEGVVIPQAMYWARPGLSDDEKRKLAPAQNVEKGLAKWGGRWRSVSVENALDGFFLSPDPQVAAKYKSRTRKLEVKVPTALLRKGVNVLAIEIHRAPAWEGMFTSPGYYEGKKTLISLSPAESWWDRSELEDIRMTAAASSAVTPNVVPPKGLRIFNHPAVVEVDPSYYGDPNEPLRPVRLRGVKNGSYSGELVAGSTEPIQDLGAQVTDLKGPGGVIPASAITVGYPRVVDGFQANRPFDRNENEWVLFDPIETAPPKEVSKVPWGFRRTFPPVQPIWVTVRVPRDARAGEYRGTVTVTAEGEKPVTTPLILEVVGDWVMPDTRDFTTYVGFLECPDAVAKHYKVAMWSEEHWKLMDKVFEVLGQVGTKDLFVPLIAKTHLGNPNSMVRWIRQPDGTYRCDTSIAERYIDTAIKHLGKIPAVCLYIATRAQYMQTLGYGNGDGRANDQSIVTEFDPKTGEMKELLPPKWGSPEAQAFWKPVIDRMRDILAKRGIEKSMMFGYLGDGLGPVAPGSAVGVPNYFSDLETIAPGTRWMVSTHINPISWRAGKLKYTDFLGVHSWMFAVVNTTRWMDEDDTAIWKPKYGWRDKIVPFSMIAASRSRSPTLENDHCANSTRLRTAAEAVLLSQAGGYTYQGFGSWGSDFWGNEWRSYDPTFGNVGLSESTALWIVGPGETGPVPTCRTRMLQEGLQEAEARIFVQNAVLDRQAQLGPHLAKRARELCDERTRMFTYIANFRYNDGEGSMPRARLIPDPAAWEENTVKLYRLADEVQKALRGR